MRDKRTPGTLPASRVGGKQGCDAFEPLTDPFGVVALAVVSEKPHVLIDGEAAIRTADGRRQCFEIVPVRLIEDELVGRKSQLGDCQSTILQAAVVPGV